MFDFLEGFDKRMQFVAVVSSIVDRKNTNLEIESWFEKDELDNLFFSLLVYIMEQTLKENDECTLDNIAVFLNNILKEYQKNLSFPQITRLAEYMVKDILQNKGNIRRYGVMNYETGWNQTAIRLISDKITNNNRIVYQLTDQGYDFLFRTKEVDKELDFKLEQMKLKELLRRKNYKHALLQSRDLIAMLRQKKRELEEFIYRVRQNINTINRGEHERLLHETYSLIDEEYEGMLLLKSEVARDEERIIKEIEESIYVGEPMQDALLNLTAIKRNLQIVINEQRNLIAERFNMNEIYEETIRNSFYSAIVKRYDFEKEVMLPLEHVNEDSIENVLKLMVPLMQSKPSKILNLLLLYQNQGKLKESEEEENVLSDDMLEEDMTYKENQRKNRVNYDIISQLLKYASSIEVPFHFSEFFQFISQDTKRLNAYITDKRIFLNMLKLYELEVIEFLQWKNREQNETITDANGEFDLAWTLSGIEIEAPDFYGLKRLIIEGGNEMFVTLLNDGIEEAVKQPKGFGSGIAVKQPKGFDSEIAAKQQKEYFNEPSTSESKRLGNKIPENKSEALGNAVLESKLEPLGNETSISKTENFGNETPISKSEVLDNVLTESKSEELGNEASVSKSEALDNEILVRQLEGLSVEVLTKRLEEQGEKILVSRIEMNDLLFIPEK